MTPGGSERADALFTPLRTRSLTLSNRIFRSATYEGMGREDGTPMVDRLAHLYLGLARGGVGAVVTGFNAVSQEGRAMHPGQCGLDTRKKEEAWAAVLRTVREASPAPPILAQLAHAGRQTVSAVTGTPVVGASTRSCTYFRQRVHALDEGGIRRIVRDFGAAALRARDAGFDGVQLHAAHGYLVHQFLSPWTNRRNDRWGERHRFCLEVVEEIRHICGPDFPLWIKLSGEEDRDPGISEEDTVALSRRLEDAGVDLLEISYGTMEQALNIIRGDCPLDEILQVNPLFSRIPTPLRPVWKLMAGPLHLRHLKPFAPLYNLPVATEVKAAVSVPVAVVGGVRTRDHAQHCVSESGMDAVGLCRPLIREPDLVDQWRRAPGHESTCTNCNLCTVYCDSGEITKCRSVPRAEVEGRST